MTLHVALQKRCPDGIDEPITWGLCSEHDEAAQDIGFGDLPTGTQVVDALDDFGKPLEVIRTEAVAPWFAKRCVPGHKPHRFGCWADGFRFGLCRCGEFAGGSGTKRSFSGHSGKSHW